jgi:hypothetical protein
MDVAKVTQDLVYVATVVHVCCKRPFSMFHLCFLTYVASEFIWMLHMFHQYVASVLSECCVCLHWFSTVFQVFLQVFQKHVSSVPSAFKGMLQVLYLDVLKVDRVLYMVCVWKGA